MFSAPLVVDATTPRTTNGDFIKSVFSLPEKATAMAWSPTGVFIACGGETGTLRIVQLAGHGQLVESATISAHKAAITVSQWDTQTDVLTTCDGAGVTHTWVPSNSNGVARGCALLLLAAGRGRACVPTCEHTLRHARTKEHRLRNGEW
jgi:WD40 repeat protein